MGSLSELFGLAVGDAGFWVGHSVYQLPVTVQRYRGGAESLVLCYLYERASGISFYSEKPVLLEVRVSQKKVAEKTGLSLWSVSQAVNSLEADKCIRVERVRDTETGQVELNVYLLLHSTTAEPLKSSPRLFGVCHQNADRPYITAPKETLKVLTQLQSGVRAVYLAALSLASLRQSLSFVVTREDWKTQTLLGKNAFNRGLKECTKRGLVKYKRQTLTVNDPVTRKPSTKSRREIVKHDGPDVKWRFSLDAITADQWQRVAEKLLHRDFTVNASGWTHTRPDDFCPFCKEARSFTMNFAQSQWKCHHCDARGRMFQLVQRVLRETQAQRVREYITAVLAPEIETADTRPAVLAGSVSDI
jgi:hypothetical protein